MSIAKKQKRLVEQIEGPKIHNKSGEVGMQILKISEDDFQMHFGKMQKDARPLLPEQ
ncbi:hypothetical protein RI367_008846, partial [Sorochytrium milnesiophthora]